MPQTGSNRQRVGQRQILLVVPPTAVKFNRIAADDINPSMLCIDATGIGTWVTAQFFVRRRRLKRINQNNFDKFLDCVSKFRVACFRPMLFKAVRMTNFHGQVQNQVP